MERREARTEDVPPLELRKLRDLELDEPRAPGRPAHVAAGSGVVRRGDFAYVIGDDELYLAVFRLSDPASRASSSACWAASCPSTRRSAAEKPDLEALTALPPFEGHPFGALFGIGSGSGPGRDRGFVWALAADGSLDGRAARGRPRAALRPAAREIGGLNVEGCSVMGDHSGCSTAATTKTGNVVAELSLADVMGSLREDLRIDAHELARDLRLRAG